MRFPIYLPWAPERARFAMKHAREGLFMLDVQLGSACNANCPRCDSSCCMLDEPADLNVDAVVALASAIDAKMVKLSDRDEVPGQPNLGFICGLGEPTAGRNMSKLKEILARTAKKNFTWSMFTNNIVWDEMLAQYLASGLLAVMIQYNSNKPGLVADMLGVSLEKAGEHLAHRRWLHAMARRLLSSGGYTNVAASIVPERDNLEELEELVVQCVEHGLFPLIGELEKAGRSKDQYYETHKLSDEELMNLRRWIKDRFGVRYEMPTCPATIGAIHINNRNIVTVDEFTGLSCGWFGMGDPKTHEIGSILKMSYDEIVRDILEYRESRIPEVKEVIAEYPDMVFGGCGGNAQKLLSDYVALYS